MLVERLHPPLRAPRRNLLAQFAEPRTIDDQLLHHRRREHQLHRGDAPLSVGPREQTQAHDRMQRLREPQLRLLLLGAREQGDRALDRRLRIGGVHRRDDAMPRLDGFERCVHRLELAHLADHDHVGVLPQRRPQPLTEVARVDPDFALRD